VNNIVLVIVSAILIILGTLGSVLPFLPGLPVALAGLLIFAAYSKFVPGWVLIVFSILTLLTIIADVLAPAIAAKGRKASRSGVIGTLIGGFVGIFIFPPFGILIGPFLGAFIGEIMNEASTEHATRVAIASVFGMILGSIFKLVVGASMFLYFTVTTIRYLF
jgi:uncharacterized protein YqgC (DUF456 family)